MDNEPLQDYEKIIGEMGVIPETAKKALAMAIENAIRNYYHAADCLVDADLKTVNIVFSMPQHKKVIENLHLTSDVLEHDILPVTFNLSSLPKAIKKVARVLFIDILNIMKSEDDFSIWKKQSRRIMDGVILQRTADHVEVDLNGTTGFLGKNAWVPGEEPLYRTGNLLFFFVSAVRRHSTGVSIFLSRSSIRLPALLFKFHLPMHQFVCTQRFIGHKSMIFTDAPVRDKDFIKIREKVSLELYGEIIETRSFSSIL